MGTQGIKRQYAVILHAWPAWKYRVMEDRAYHDGEVLALTAGGRVGYVEHAGLFSTEAAAHERIADFLKRRKPKERPLYALHVETVSP